MYVLDFYVKFNFDNCMLKQLQLHSICFLVAKYRIAHSRYSALICQFLVPSQQLTTTCDAIRLSQLKFLSMFHFALI
jgi:hypothetical protein